MKEKIFVLFITLLFFSKFAVISQDTNRYIPSTNKSIISPKDIVNINGNSQINNNISINVNHEDSMKYLKMKVY